jgi:hypothetical protein
MRALKGACQSPYLKEVYHSLWLMLFFGASGKKRWFWFIEGRFGGVGWWGINSIKG